MNRLQAAVTVVSIAAKVIALALVLIERQPEAFRVDDASAVRELTPL
jgi:hypothetical protein